MKINGNHAAVAITAMLVTFAALYNNLIPSTVFIGIVGVIVGNYFGEIRGLRKKNNQRG